MFSSLRLRLHPGRIYAGPAAYVDGNGEGDPRHGFYALTPDGKALRRPLVRLTAVALPDGSHRYEIARRGEPPHRREDNVVPLEFHGQGEAAVATGPAEQTSLTENVTPQAVSPDVVDSPAEPVALTFTESVSVPCAYSWAIGPDNVAVFCQLPAGHEGQPHTVIVDGLMRHPA